MEKYRDRFIIYVLVAVTNCFSIIGVCPVPQLIISSQTQACANTVILINTGMYMEKYGDHFNIYVLVAVTNCTSIVGVYTVVIDHFFPSTGMC